MRDASVSKGRCSETLLSISVWPTCLVLATSPCHLLPSLPRLMFPNSLERFSKCSFPSLLSHYGQVVSLPSPLVPGVTRWCYFSNKFPLCCSALQPLETGFPALGFVLQLLSWAAASSSEGLCSLPWVLSWANPFEAQVFPVTESASGFFDVEEPQKTGLFLHSLWPHCCAPKLLVCSVKHAQVSLKMPSDFVLLGTHLGPLHPVGVFLHVPRHVLLLQRRSVCEWRLSEGFLLSSSHLIS